MAVERLKACDNIVALSEELGVHRRLLYKWRDQLDPLDVDDGPPPENPRESTLRKEVSQLKRLLAEKTMELDFFKGALQKAGSTPEEIPSSGSRWKALRIFASSGFPAAVRTFAPLHRTM